MFEVAERVPREALAEFEARQREAFGPEFRVKAFDFGGDRRWHPLEPKPAYVPLVFIEPAPPESLVVLGLDLDSNEFLRRSLQESARLCQPVATRPFRLVEGPLAYVLHRPAGPLADAGDEDLFRYDRYALIVVRADTLLPPSYTADRLRTLLYHRDFPRNDPRGHLYFSRVAASGWLEAALFPDLQFEEEVGSDTQPFALAVSRQIGWSDLRWSLLGIVVATGLITFAVMLAYARLYHERQMQRLAEADRLFHLANYDRLTGLPNRNLFMDRLHHALVKARRHGTRVAVLFLDLDRFKHVNDAYGHDAGDEVLRLAGGRLRDCLRASDTVARRSGDEFVALLEGIGRNEIPVVVAKIRAAFAEPFQVEGKDLEVGASIGAASSARHGLEAAQLLRAADAAMYADKRRGSVA